MSSVTVYTTDPCPFCLQAKALLTKRGIPFEEVSMAKDPAGRAELIEKTGRMTFPQVVIDGQVVGGFSELRELDRSGRLLELVDRAA